MYPRKLLDRIVDFKRAAYKSALEEFQSNGIYLG